MTEEQRANAKKAKDLANWKQKIKATPLNLKEIQVKMKEAQQVGGPNGVRF
jgi:hypothetical protein